MFSMKYKHEINRLNAIVKKINDLRPVMNQYTDLELKNKAFELKERYNQESPKSLLPEAFALVREASKRALGKEHYDVQLMGGIVLSEGKIAEAKTGEGKTITIYLPAFLASLSGESVYVVTVNDYLAHRDAMEAAKVFNMLGVDVGLVLHDDEPEKRKMAYRCDITYVTNVELGFDYLRDHLTHAQNNVVLNGLHYAIIDEIDSILIDEAKTPLIISGEGPEIQDFLKDVDDFVRGLTEGKETELSTADKLMGEVKTETGDFVKNEKHNEIVLTEVGMKKAEERFQTGDYENTNTMLIQKAINNALIANYYKHKNVDYVVKDDKVVLIDQSTGRSTPGRRFANGLHQALEVKERVEIQRENVTIGSITFQSFFNKFEKKAGLTGTAMTSAKEFKDIYHLDVIEIPTNKPVIRNDMDDLVFRNKTEKWAAVAKAVEETHKTGQPILVGTASIEDSVIVSNMLDKIGIEHNTLNANNEDIEADIIATAGQFGSVTVATNMAGRGTDIILDDKSREAGGLKVIGTERHDSRRIDNQLKGRSGRQGDPGSSQFFISLEDRTMSIFGDQSAVNMLLMMATEPGEPLQHKSLSKMVNKAQETIESEHRLMREHMLKYDESDNEHREQIYEQREEILNERDLNPIMENLFDDLTSELIDKFVPNDCSADQWDLTEFIKEYKKQFPNIDVDEKAFNVKSKDELKSMFKDLNKAVIAAKNKMYGNPKIATIAQRYSFLKAIDDEWIIFLNSMDYIKKTIGAQAYAQRDPSAEYKKRGVKVFNQMIENIQSNVPKFFLGVNPEMMARLVMRDGMVEFDDEREQAIVDRSITIDLDENYIMTGCPEKEAC